MHDPPDRPSRSGEWMRDSDEPRLDTGRVTAVERAQFTNSDCSQLAAVLHHRTGWPVALVITTDADESGNHGWLHAGVMSQSGKFVDVKGQREVGDVLEEWICMLDEDEGDDPHALDVHEVGDGSTYPEVTPSAAAVAVADKLLGPSRPDRVAT